ncbi:hypothetical protein T02_1524 [Trichinella nativa]|uniref:Uncharacterized protein n=1 Tax=Trichinella nativa TaxID=6335 RepID=A0A0V1L4H7_9BILA|nr:hypothetical protein T02_1524 [Trichinella nativa]
MPSKNPIALAPKNKYQRRSSSGMVKFLNTAPTTTSPKSTGCCVERTPAGSPFEDRSRMPGTKSSPTSTPRSTSASRTTVVWFVVPSTSGAPIRASVSSFRKFDFQPLPFRSPSRPNLLNNFSPFSPIPRK